MGGIRLARRPGRRRRAGGARGVLLAPRGGGRRGRRLRARPRQPRRDLHLRPDARRARRRRAAAARQGGPARASPRRRSRRSSWPGSPSSGRIELPATVEGGDTVWLDDETLLVGIGYRTNPAAVEALRAAFPGVEVISFDLPHWNGAGEVMHLMSFISPLDRDLALVYPRIAPTRLMWLLAERGIARGRGARRGVRVPGPERPRARAAPRARARGQRRDPSPDGARRRRRRHLSRRRDLAQGRRRPDLPHAPCCAASSFLRETSS